MTPARGSSEDPTDVIDRAFIRRWADSYVADMKESEARLFEEIGPDVARRGFYNKAEFLEVGRWKANRVTGFLGKNSEDDVHDITRCALEAPFRLRHRLLCVLSGVGRPMASALLTVWRPNEHTILDVNAVDALHHFGKLPSARVADVTYEQYVTVCRSIVDELGHGITLRDLDRALWKWWDER